MELASNTNKKGESHCFPQRISYFCIVMYKHLTREQRYAIYLGIQKGETQKSIAQTIGVSASTLSREIKRNSTRNQIYVWTKAHDSANKRKRRSPGNRAIKPEVKWRIKQLIKDEQWSPKQISGALAKNEGIYVSHESIYKMIRQDRTGELAKNCRHKMKYTRKNKSVHVTKATNIKNRVSIHQRPIEADGKRLGDWEMDLIVDKGGNAILTMIERSTNYLLMAKLKEGKKAMPLAMTVRRLLLPYKGTLKTITTDNGSEFAAHEWITDKLGVQVYFTDSYSSWQKGAVENTNKLVRQYIPKGTDISTITDAFIMKIQKKINARPREKLKFATPKDEFFKYCS